MEPRVLLGLFQLPSRGRSGGPEEKGGQYPLEPQSGEAWALGIARKASLCSGEQLPRALTGKSLALALSQS